MNRRDFLNKSAQTIALGAVLGSFPLTAFGRESLLAKLLMPTAIQNDNVLVIIQLTGGNDGLNMLIPLDQYSVLSTLRSNILIDDSKVLKLPNQSNTGLHPSMSKILELYKEQKIQFVQGVGYANQNFSHFRSTDIWLSGADADQVLYTGAMGRFLNFEYPNYPSGYPNTTMPDPIAIQIGAFVSPIFQGPVYPMATAIGSDKDFYDIVNGTFPAVNSDAIGKELTYIRSVMAQASDYNSVIKAAATKVTAQSTYPTDNALADQLKIVAKLIAGGLKTKIYMVEMGSFDTHSAQVDSADKTKGKHADLLSELSEAVYAFQRDLEYLGVDKRVAGMTFSEFGRRIASNGSLGTDHGSSLPMMIFGDRVQGGVIGSNPQISSSTTVADNLAMQYDFRSVYASIFAQHFCVEAGDLNTILLKNYQSLPILKSEDCTSSIHTLNQVAGISWISAYPNPCTDNISVEYTANGGYLRISIFDTEGREVAVLIDEISVKGSFTKKFNTEWLNTGIYYIRYQNDSIAQVFTMIVER